MGCVCAKGGSHNFLVSLFKFFESPLLKVHLRIFWIPVHSGHFSAALNSAPIADHFDDSFSLQPNWIPALLNAQVSILINKSPQFYFSYSICLAFLSSVYRLLHF